MVVYQELADVGKIPWRILNVCENSINCAEPKVYVRFCFLADIKVKEQSLENLMR